MKTNLVRRVTLVALTVSAFSVMALFLLGVRGFIVETPSMGQAAPVGSLVITMPVMADSVKVGDIVSFRPTEAPNEVYSHRVSSIDGLGIHTKGDINGAADPWALHQTNLIGAVDMILPVFGWVVKALPILSLGFGTVWLATMYIPSRNAKSALRTLGSSAVVAYTVNLIKPLISYVVLTQTPTVGGMTSRVVSTGLIPIQFTGAGSPVILRSGQVGNVQSLADPKTGLVHLAAAMHLDGLGWGLAFAVCAIPTLWSVLSSLAKQRSLRAKAKPIDDTQELQDLVSAQRPAHRRANASMNGLIGRYVSVSETSNAKHT